MARRRKKQTPVQRRALAMLLLAQKRYDKDPSRTNVREMKAAAKRARELDALTVYEDV